ncbi:hypothetical protein ADL04_09885 [Streptomyces sp. NRRL B-3648]|nr:hypothetical protein ADL04_09885 [Streptomyces sp. NRRL B-3648]
MENRSGEGVFSRSRTSGTSPSGPGGRTRGRLDLLVQGEWVHAGDVREVPGEPGVYAGAGRPVTGAACEPAGAREAELNVFGRAGTVALRSRRTLELD